MSLTAYTSDWSFEFGVWSLRWHLNEKLLLGPVNIGRASRETNTAYELSLSSTYLTKKKVTSATVSHIDH